MTTQYSVIRFVPDMVADERANIGVVAWDDSTIHVRFVKDWRRAKALTSSNIDFLKDFAKELEFTLSSQLDLPGLRGNSSFDILQLEQLLKNWKHSIQFSEARGSIKSARDVLEDIAPRYLPARLPKHGRARDRRVAVKQAKESLECAVRASLESRGVTSKKVSDVVRSRVPVQGQYEEHTADLGLVNGNLKVVAQGMSFETSSQADLQREIDATKWTIDDIRKADQGLIIGIITLPPTHDGKAMVQFNRTRKIFRAMDADVVVEKHIRKWAEGKAEAVVKSINCISSDLI